MTQENATNADIIEKELERTDLGHVINQNKNKVLGFFAVVVVVAAVVSFYTHKQKKSLTADLSVIHTFKQSAITPYLEGKITTEDFVGKFNSASNEIKGNPVFLTQILAVAKKMEETDGPKAYEVIKGLEKNISDSNPLFLIYALKFAALSEDYGAASDAIPVLEKAMNQKGEGIKAQVYLQLGRLYRTVDVGRAKKNFEFIVEKFSSDPSAKMAKLYLAELK